MLTIFFFFEFLCLSRKSWQWKSILLLNFSLQFYFPTCVKFWIRSAHCAVQEILCLVKTGIWKAVLSLWAETKACISVHFQTVWVWTFRSKQALLTLFTTPLSEPFRDLFSLNITWYCILCRYELFIVMPRF
jgi:hypothetical protein